MKYIISNTNITVTDYKTSNHRHTAPPFEIPLPGCGREISNVFIKKPSLPDRFRIDPRNVPKQSRSNGFASLSSCQHRILRRTEVRCSVGYPQFLSISYTDHKLVAYTLDLGNIGTVPSSFRRPNEHVS